MAQNTPSGESLHLAFFGLRNAGKSSLVNAVTGQSVSITSAVKGTTTDPVRKSMELLPLGPVVIIDTPGLDDEGELGALRVERTRRILDETDLAVLVTDCTCPLTADELALMATLTQRKIPHILVKNKADLLAERPDFDGLYVSARTGEGVRALKEALAKLAACPCQEKRIVADLLSPGDHVVLITPIDASAPKGRLILPQQQTIRDILEAGCCCTITQPEQYPAVLKAMQTPPRLVITDSQVFGKVDAMTPPDVPLTSFSILFARYKGELNSMVQGAAVLDSLRDGDRVLISEGCTHHRQCGDIGTVKLPAWIRKHTGVKPDFHFTSGGEFPADLSSFALVIHCGGCMLNGAEMKSRLARAVSQKVPMTNYGMAIAKLHGILDRSMAPLQIK